MIFKWKFFGKTLFLKSHLSGGVLLAMMINLAFPWRIDFKVCLYPKQNLPDFITKAKRALIRSKAFSITQKYSVSITSNLRHVYN